MSGDDNGYRVARLTLIRGIRALSKFPRASVILAGAHAVYHHAPEAVGAMSPFTLDGDLVADPRLIKHPRKLYDALHAAGFSLRNVKTGGLYTYDAAPPEERYAAQLDIFVPTAFATRWVFEGYNKLASLATFDQDGLELCLIDHAPLKLGPIDCDDDSQSVEVQVAGVFALLIAKGHKIGDRHAQGDEAFELVQKDIADIYRLLVTFNSAEVAEKIRGLEHHSPVREITRVGAAHVRNLCGRGGAGSKLLSRYLGTGEEAIIIVDSLETLAEEFSAIVCAALDSSAL